MQNWIKLGLIYDKQDNNSVPVATFIDDNVIRIYATSRSPKNKSFPFFIDYDLSKNKVLREQKINISLGGLGTFDEYGIMPTSLIKRNNQIWLYYIGWNLATSVPFRNSIGLAISKDGGVTFEKYSEGPILDRSIFDPCFVASNCIYEEESFFRMYYLSCDKWEYKNDELVHSYNIKYAESKDGINWTREGIVCIDFRFENEYAISVPRVIKENGVYKMWYSFRGNNDIQTYRIGYAESNNAVDWIRKDEEVNFDTSKKGWDSEMVCYPFIFIYKNEKYMLYNGNNYGKTGIGLSKLKL
jgi:hypothetical protein